MILCLFGSLIAQSWLKNGQPYTHFKFKKNQMLGFKKDLKYNFVNRHLFIANTINVDI